MYMKKLSLVLCATMLAGIGSKAMAQVQDVSFTVAPVVGYTHWDSKLNLGDSPFWGVRAGFGFGPLVEIRGIYERTFDLKGKLKNNSSTPSWLLNWADKLEDSNVDIKRYGGELKFNLWSNSFITPYLTAGGGIMELGYTATPVGGTATSYKEKQIYGAGGVGLKFNMGRRVSLSLEGKDLIFNVNPSNRYLASAANGGDQLHNWTGQASLDIYFGGTDYDSGDAISRAYRNMYSDGFRGVKFVLEPGIAYVDYPAASGLKPQWFLGGSAGFDFSSIFGIRGFYYSATKTPGTLDFNLNNELRMYGGNFVARLNMPRGLTPYLNLGAGYREVTGKFTPTIAGATPKSGLFLFGGGGLEIPLFKYVALYGSINAMLSEQENPAITSVTDPADVKVNAFYQAGVRFNFGRSNRDGRELYQSYSDAQTRSEVARLQESNLEEMNALRADYDARIKKLNAQRADYDARIKKLNEELADAVSRRDTITVTRVLREKSEVADRITDVDNQTAQVAQQKPQVAQQGRTVMLTKAQFDALVNQVVSDLKREKGSQVSVSDVTGSNLSDLDKILLLNALYRSPYAAPNFLGQPVQAQPQVQPQQLQSQDSSKADPNIALVKRLDQVIDRLDAINTTQAQQIAGAQQSGKSSDDIRLIEQYLQNEQNRRDRIIVAGQNEKDEVYAKEVKVKPAKETLKFNRAALFVGPNFGDQVGVNVGARGYMQILDSQFDFAPDAYVAFGKKTGFGLNANILYNLPTFLDGAITPYVGVGLGVNSIGGVSRFLPNFVVGTSLGNVLGGRVFVDYTARGAFRNNQLAVGYRFNF